MKPLSKQQDRILRLLAQGRTNIEIALVVGLRESAVKALVTKVFELCGISSRQQAASHLRERDAKIKR